MLATTVPTRKQIYINYHKLIVSKTHHKLAQYCVYQLPHPNTETLYEAFPGEHKNTSIPVLTVLLSPRSPVHQRVGRGFSLTQRQEVGSSEGTTCCCRGRRDGHTQASAAADYISLTFVRCAQVGIEGSGRFVGHIGEGYKKFGEGGYRLQMLGYLDLTGVIAQVAVVVLCDRCWRYYRFSLTWSAVQHAQGQEENTTRIQQSQYSRTRLAMAKEITIRKEQCGFVVVC